MTKVTRPDQGAAPQPVPGAIPFGPAASGAGQSIVIPLLGGSNVKLVVPPGGFAGFAQQTAATQELFRKAGRVGGRRSAAKRRKAKAKAAPARKRRSKARGKRAARLAKGSAAAKRYMANLRKRRKK
jgi:hypothetical protein